MSWVWGDMGSVRDEVRCRCHRYGEIWGGVGGEV